MVDEPLLLFSCDGHVGLPTAEYRDYMDPGDRPAFDDFLARHRARWTAEHPEGFFDAGFKRSREQHPRLVDGGIEGLRDPARRLAELDRDGVAGEVLFPDDQHANSPPFLVGIAPKCFDQPWAPALERAGARAYNRWLAEFCSEAPDRLLGVATVGSLEDVDGAIAELTAAREAGLRGGLMLPLHYQGLPFYNDRRYEPLWAACADLDMPLITHTGSGEPPQGYGDGPDAPMLYILEAGWFAHRPLWHLLLSGVFDRHPRLKLFLTEQGATWVVDTLAQLDQLVQAPLMEFAQRTPLPRLPSETFREHCWVGSSLATPAEFEVRATIGRDRLLWGSDYPHLESSWPELRPRLRELVQGLPEEDVRAFCGENLARAYGLDLDALRDYARRLGPRPASILS